MHLCFINEGVDAGGSMVLVGQDGVQRPAIHFPAGGHLLAFLTCLETGLQPRGRLDPPLWSQTGKGRLLNIRVNTDTHTIRGFDFITAKIDHLSKLNNGSSEMGGFFLFQFLAKLIKWQAKFCAIWKGKVFPKIKRKGPLHLFTGKDNAEDSRDSGVSNGNEEEQPPGLVTESSDYVFRIIMSNENAICNSGGSFGLDPNGLGTCNAGRLKKSPPNFTFFP